MNGVTIKDLFALISEQMARGNGDKTILISRDDEGNGFHTLFYGFEDDKSTINEFSSYGLIECGTDLDSIVLLG